MRLLAILLLCATIGLAQNVTGTILGTVTDFTSGAVPGARVVVTNDRPGQRREIMTDGQGGYVVNFLPVVFGA